MRKAQGAHRNVFKEIFKTVCTSWAITPKSSTIHGQPLSGARIARPNQVLGVEFPYGKIVSPMLAEILLNVDPSTARIISYFHGTQLVHGLNTLLEDIPLAQLSQGITDGKLPHLKDGRFSISQTPFIDGEGCCKHHSTQGNG